MYRNEHRQVIAQIFLERYERLSVDGFLCNPRYQCRKPTSSMRITVSHLDTGLYTVHACGESVLVCPTKTISSFETIEDALKYYYTATTHALNNGYKVKRIN